ncbi:MAG: hypothetical protein K0U78_13530 [Actinomycetia bacterium]|nr:hypothetical protein [Actinomycetes bacterium]
MSLPLLLLGAKTGADLLGMFGQRAATQANIQMQETANRLNQFQQERQGRLLADERRRQFASALGAQRAQVASAGIVGGRTARLLEAESQNTYTRQRQEDEMQQRFGRLQTQNQSRALSMASRMADRQFGINLFSTAVGAGLQGQQISQARTAEGL